MTVTANPSRVVDVAVYGIINAGKSSLINALSRREVASTSPIGGTTTAVAVEPWREVRAEVGPYAVRLIDTPGLEEVGDAVNASLAAAAARQADLILFVTAEDLTATARAALVALRDAGKPLLVAVNKVDLLDPAEREAVLAAVRTRLAGLISAEDVIATAAAPIERERVEGSDGTARTEVRRGVPRIAELEARLIEAIAASAPDLKALNEASERVDRHVVDRDAEIARRRSRAEAVADETSVALALALAINPVPLLDFLTGSGGLAILVRRVAEVYDAKPSAEVMTRLAKELMRSGRARFWGSLTAVGMGGALKFLPGLGHLAGALTQATSAGYVSHIFGRALVHYYENGHDWGDGGLAAALDRIAAATDRRALTRGLVERLKARLDRHP
jgi:small GTP-binding protein